MKCVAGLFTAILIWACIGNMEDGLKTNDASVEGEWNGVRSVEKDTPLCHAESRACVRYDAIVVLGGGPQGRDGLPPLWVRRRLDAAVELDLCCTKNEERESSLRFITTSLGSAHAPNARDRDGFPISEAQASADYLMSKGIARERIFQEAASWDTIGNAFFTRQLHTSIRGWTRLLVVTSDFHLARSRAIFEWIFSLPPYAPAEYQRAKGYVLGFVGVDDGGVPGVTERMDKEAKSLSNIMKMAEDDDMVSMGQVHEWMYREHEAYASGKKIERLQDKTEKATYGG